jgi:hypothetical protein
MLKLREYKQFRLPVKIMGHIIGFLFCVFVLPLAPIVLWAMLQCEINRRKNKAMVKLNNWAIYNSDTAQALGIEPNYVMAIPSSGITKMYLNLTSSNTNKVFEECIKKGIKIAGGKKEELSQLEIFQLKGKIEGFEKFEKTGCAIFVLMFCILYFGLAFS